jgi:hypothetical protein
MKKAFLIVALALAALLGHPREASADITFFLGFHPQPLVHQTRGISAGINMLIFGFEFEYADSKEDFERGIPRLQTGMFNFLVQTPTNVSIYVTAGGGFFRESVSAAHVLGWGTNIGGGVKFPIFGQLKVRVDYRVFKLRSNALYTAPQRIYVGVNWAF